MSKLDEIIELHGNTGITEEDYNNTFKKFADALIEALKGEMSLGKYHTTSVAIDLAYQNLKGEK